MTLRQLIETHFGMVLLLSCAIGLIVPGIAKLPNISVVIALAVLMFFSCYRLRDGGIRSIRWRDIGIFYGLRFLALPFALWLLARGIAPDYAMGIFLLSVLPAGVASPAFAGIYGGAVPPAFALVVLSQLAAPFLIPLQFTLIGDAQVTPPAGQMFITMVECILLPMGVYALVRRHAPSADYIYARNRLYSVLLIAFVIAFAIAKQREVLLTQGIALLTPLLVSLGCFAGYILFGWAVSFSRPRAERITFAACSGFNNAALGVSLALLYFPPPVVLFLAISEIGWALLPWMFRAWMRIAPL